MAIRNTLTENIIMPLGDLIMGLSISKHLRKLNSSQWWSRDQIENHQNEELRKLVTHAYNSVPYYRDLFIKLKLTPTDIQNKEDLEKIPILTKDTIKREGISRFLSDIYPIQKLIKNSSSGSTGEP